MALSELQRKKAAKLFRVYDVDRDGYLERADFTRRAEAFARMRGWSQDSPRYREHLDFTVDDWRGLREFADADEDGRVELGEYLAFAAAVLSEPQAVEAYAYTDALLLFRAMDTDDDGRITAEEYRTYLGVYGLDPAVADEFFRRADRDGDGFLTGDELVEAKREFLLSDDPAAAGNYLYGPLD